jgi:hypothetical protein
MLHKQWLVIGTFLALAAPAHAHANTPARSEDDPARSAGLAERVRPRAPSYVEMKNEQVMRAFLVFAETQRAPDHGDSLTGARAREEVLVPVGPEPNAGRAAAYGAAMLSATVVLAAHAPAPLRPLFDARLHLGPAVFESGGMGAGVGGRF